MGIKLSQLLESQFKLSYSGWLVHRIEKQPELLKPVVSNQKSRFKNLNGLSGNNLTPKHFFYTKYIKALHKPLSVLW